MNSGWFDYTEPSLTTSSQQPYTLGPGGSRSEPPRTFLNNVSAEKARCVEVPHEFEVVRLY